jgi:hypothetical protein
MDLGGFGANQLGSGEGKHRSECYEGKIWRHGFTGRTRGQGGENWGGRLAAMRGMVDVFIHKNPRTYSDQRGELLYQKIRRFFGCFP